MVDLNLIAKKFNTTQDGLKRVFTRKRPENFESLKDDEKAQIEKDLKARERLETLLQDRLQDSLSYSLRNYSIYAAVDLAWDSAPINKSTLPLMMLAQGKIDKQLCASSLTAAGFGKYVTRDEKGQVKDVNLPKFLEGQINLIRSILTRRLAAQSNKYANLWPYYRYEARGTSLPEKLLADLVSQRMDIMADQYDHKHHEVQVIREILLYAQVVDFVRSSWECEKQERYKRQPAGLETNDGETETVVVKEGVAFVNPHPSRVFWDTAYPLISLNTDTGCTWVGYWDVCRYRDIQLDPTYWNRDAVSYSSNTTGLFSTYAQYFTQYYTVINAPSPIDELSAPNDRKNNVGTYTGNMGDSSMIKAEFFMKLKPIEYGLGDYPHDVWVRFVLAGEKTVLFAEYLPSTPASVTSHNCNDSRLINISFAHELMGYQDQLTNLYTHLLLCLGAEHIRVLVIDKDVADPEHIKAFREQVRGATADPGTVVLEISRKKMEELGLTDPSKVITLVETKSMAIEAIMRAIGQLISMVERMAALSPQEQGQPAPREISATESNLIAGTTESVYGFISDSIDEGRAAKKRILLESWLVKGQSDFNLPVMGRYPKKVIQDAGFTADGGEYDVGSKGDVARYNVKGKKQLLEHDYIFTTRDGAERPVNTQSAATLVQLLQVLMSVPAVAQNLTKEQLYGMVNEIFRQSGAGYDLLLELQPGEDPAMGPDPNQIVKDIAGNMDGLTTASESNKNEIEQIKAVLTQLQQGMGQPQALPRAA